LTWSNDSDVVAARKRFDVDDLTRGSGLRTDRTVKREMRPGEANVGSSVPAENGEKKNGEKTPIFSSSRAKES
jgi:hypothetical protein